MQADDLAIDIIVDLLESQTGQRIAADRRWRIAPALAGLLRELDIASLPDLIVELTRSDDEGLPRTVVEALLNNETYFFRDRQVFDHVDTVILPQLAQERAAERSLRIWSAGCSTGQEALSLAMLFARQPSRWHGWTVEIVATDVSHSVIDFARRATYSNFQIQRGLGVTEMLGFFRETPGGWQASPQLAGMVSYEVQNLLGPPPAGGAFDLILCRNVLLYFDNAARARAFARLAEATRLAGRLVLGGGELVLGRTENFAADTAMHGVFRLVDPAARRSQAAVSA